MAARYGKAKACEVLLECGCEVMPQQVGTGDTPLHMATRHQHGDVVALLMQHVGVQRGVNVHRMALC